MAGSLTLRRPPFNSCPPKRRFSRRRHAGYPAWFYPVGTSSAGGNLATITLNWPTNILPGDYAILAWTYQTTFTITTGPVDAGYANQGSQSGGTGSHVSEWYDKLVDVSDTPGGSITLTLSGANRQSASLYVIRGAHPTTPLDTSQFRQETLTQVNHALPALTPNFDGCAFVVIYSERSSVGNDVVTAPADYTLRVSSGNRATGSGGTLTAISDDGLQRFVRPASVSETPPDYIGTSTPNVKLWTISVRPPAAASSVTFDGSAPAAADATGDTAVDRPLAGVSSAAADAPASLAVDRPLAAVASSANGATATLSVARPLAAVASAAAGVAADLLIVWLNAGTGSAAASATGDVSVGRGLAATAPASAAVTAALSAARDLATTAAAASDAASALSVARTLDAAASAACDASAVLSVTRPLASSAPAASSATASLMTSGFEGTASAAASATGWLSTNVLRPSTGTTSRPSTGSTVRPNAGITYRP